MFVSNSKATNKQYYSFITWAFIQTKNPHRF